jgi:ribosomal protein S18 acetylase RimI-like enzyme
MSIRLAPVDPSLIHQAFLSAFADYAMDAGGTTEDSLLLRMRKNAVDYAASVGAYDDDRLVGFTLIGIDHLDGVMTAFDAGTGILPAYRGQGLAKRMFEHVVPSLRSLGVRRFLLEVLQQNEPAIRAYQKSGFETIRTLRCFVANADELRNLPAPDGLMVRSTTVAALEGLVPHADFSPSFENRFTAHREIPHEVEIYGVCDGEDVVGALSYCRKLNWLLSLIVARTHRRRGIGRALLRHFAIQLPKSVDRLTALNIDSAAAGALAFFESCGFSLLIDQYEMEYWI